MWKTNKFWLILLGALFVASSLAALAPSLLPGRASTARVYSDGRLAMTIDLSAVQRPYETVVEGEFGANAICVERGRVRVSEADCPDGLCIGQGWSVGASPLVCLPNRLLITFEGSAASLTDAVVG